MPLFESGCTACGTVREWYAKLSTSPDPDCCGAPMRRLISRFGIVWTGPISKYNDPTKERVNQTKDGSHWVWKVRSSKSGHPEKVLITNRQEQREFVKAEGLLDPAECPANADISSDGHRLSSQGMPGSWI
jgi:predicted nucleic acid-binding Zn ribbon protein